MVEVHRRGDCNYLTCEITDFIAKNLIVSNKGVVFDRLYRFYLLESPRCRGVYIRRPGKTVGFVSVNADGVIDKIFFEDSMLNYRGGIKDLNKYVGKRLVLPLY